MYIIFQTVVGVLLFVLAYKFLKPKQKTNYPPGPRSLPLIGTIHITQDAPHIACMKLAEKYGPLVAVDFAHERAVVLHGAKLIRGAFSELSMCGRDVIEANSFIMGDGDGILQASGDVWYQQRRFARKTLRDFGFGRTSMEEMILKEAKELADWLQVQAGAPVELGRRFKLAVVNSLWKIVAGERFKHDDPEIHEILKKIDRTEIMLLESPMRAMIYFFYPAIAKIFPNWSRWRVLTETANAKTEFFDRIIQEHAETRREGQPRDFIDVYLQEMVSLSDTRAGFTQHSLRSVISDLFMAGSDTSAVTMEWMILYLLHNPHVQRKMQAELDSVLGSSEAPSLKDRERLPYVECVVMEVLRCSSIAPIGVGHLCMEDVQLGGYDIKKGTVLFPNIYQAHHDPVVWGDPEVFSPERFLNEDGSCVHRHESLMPFSVGRRACMGESLARDILFIFTAALIHKFEVGTADLQSEKPTLEPRLGKIFLEPRKFYVSMKNRKLASS